MQLLLLSSSREGDTGYLEHARAWIADHIGQRELLFVPFAGVAIDWDDYTQRVQAALSPIGIRVDGIHRAQDARAAIDGAQAIAIGGGNTFHLLKALYDRQLVEVIRHRVQGGMPYLGWSAGSNVAAPTICTTNDMPIVQPASFDALNLVPFQINPHYNDWTPPNFHGETRAERLTEFLAANPDRRVVALREGSALRRTGTALKLLGQHPALLFEHGREMQTLTGPELGSRLFL